MAKTIKKYFLLCILCKTTSAFAINLYPIVWTNYIKLTALNQIPELLVSKKYLGLDSKNITPLEMYSPQNRISIASTCTDYLTLLSKNFTVEGTLDKQYEADVFINNCLPLNYLQKAQPAKISFLRDFDFEKDYGLLPAKLIFPKIPDGDPRPDPHGTLKTFYPTVKIISKTKNRLILQSKIAQQTAIITLLAKADFDGQGYDQILISLTTSIDGGSYFERKICLLTKKANNSPFELVEVSPLHNL